MSKLVQQQLVKHILYKFFCVSYQVPFHLWRIGSVLKHCKAFKYFNQVCIIRDTIHALEVTDNFNELDDLWINSTLVLISCDISNVKECDIWENCLIKDNKFTYIITDKTKNVRKQLSNILGKSYSVKCKLHSNIFNALSIVTM